MKQVIEVEINKLPITTTEILYISSVEKGSFEKARAKRIIESKMNIEMTDKNFLIIF